jgi:HTH-type transcriptional regulator/antitoxin HigA
MTNVIRNDQEHARAISRISDLILSDASEGSAESEEIVLLGMLVEAYEKERFLLEAVDAVSAVRFRMEQLGLAPRDLIPLFGSRSRVSEFLSGKRQLSLAMVQTLHENLGIPYACLHRQAAEGEGDAIVLWERFPLREMIKRGWVVNPYPRKRGALSSAVMQDLIEAFFSPIGGVSATQSVLHRQGEARVGASTDRYALMAWAAHVLRRAERVEVSREFVAQDWNAETIAALRSLSRESDGARRAVGFLEERGIVVDVVPHLPRTKLDGAAMRRSDGVPVIALTLRYDRVDNFWFTLMHELGHVVRHFSGSSLDSNDQELFFDDLDVPASVDVKEREADDFARESLIPKDMWEASAVRYVVAPETARLLAEQVGVAPAVVAGRVRYEKNNYRLLAGLVDSGAVRKQFPEVNWGA